MSSPILAPIITAAAALGGVTLTLWMTGRRERIKADQEGQREQARVSEQRWQWNRTQRLNAYVQLINATYMLASRFRDSAELAQEGALAESDIRSHTIAIEQLIDTVRVQVHLVSLIGSENMTREAYGARSACRHVASRFELWSRLLVVGPRFADEQEQVGNASEDFSQEIRRLYDLVDNIVETAQAELHPDLASTEDESGVS